MSSAPHFFPRTVGSDGQTNCGSPGMGIRVYRHQTEQARLLFKESGQQSLLPITGFEFSGGKQVFESVHVAAHTVCTDFPVG